MKRVVQRLELYTTYSRKRYLKTEEIYTSSPFYVHMDSLSLTRLKYPLRINFTPDENALIVEGNYHESIFQTKINQLPAVINTPAGVVYIKLRSNNNQQIDKIKSYTSGSKLKKEDLPDDKIEVEINNPVSVAKSIIKGALSTEVG